MSDMTVKVIMQYINENNTYSSQNSAYTIPNLNNIVQVTVGYGNSFAVLDNEGYIWTWCESAPFNTLYDSLFNSSTPSKLTTLQNVVYILQNKYMRNLAAVLNDGTIYIYGDNSGGQYGLGNSTASSINFNGDTVTITYNSNNFNLINGFPVNGSKIVKVVFIFASVAILLDNGDVWIWGYNHNDIFYFGTDFLIPTKISVVNIIDICATENMLVLLNCESDVLFYGKDFSSNLHIIPLKINAYSNITRIFSNNNQVFLLDESNKLIIYDGMAETIKKKLKFSPQFDYTNITNNDNTSKAYNFYNHNFNNGAGFTGVKNLNIQNKFTGNYIGKINSATIKKRIVKFDSKFVVPTLSNPFDIILPDTALNTEDNINVTLTNQIDKTKTIDKIQIYLGQNVTPLNHIILNPPGMVYTNYINFDVLNTSIKQDTKIYFISSTDTIGNEISTVDNGYGAYFQYIVNDNLTSTYNSNLTGIRIFTTHFTDVIITQPTKTTAPCFSYETLIKILNTLDENKKNKVNIIYDERKDKKIYRCTFKNYGDMEFTLDHQFLYNEKIIDFEELIKNNSNISNVRFVDINEISTVYNLHGNEYKYHDDNMFKLYDDLYVIGCTIIK
jgi:hypothetical protein